MQLGLFESPAQAVSRYRCDSCKAGHVTVTRTADIFEDDWRCDTCPAYGNISWSRVFGERAEEQRGSEVTR